MEILYREKLIKLLMDKIMELESISEWRGSEVDRLKAENEYLRRKMEQFEKCEASENVFEEV